MSKEKTEQKKGGWKKALKIVLIVLLAIVLLVVGFFLVLTVTEYKPKDVDPVEIAKGNDETALKEGDSFRIVSWNTGYGGLSSNADFFMDGGKSVVSTKKPQVQTNIENIAKTVKELEPDVIFFQEVDEASSRTFNMNQIQFYNGEFAGYDTTFAYNYHTLCVPYPLPPLGKIYSGISTYSKFPVTEANRVALFCPFGYPIRLCNLKRCLLVNRVKLEGSDKELVLVNLHLEAYDSGEGKIQQTKQLKELLEAEAKKGNYVIAGGDFNQSFSNCDISMYPVVGEDLWKPGFIDVSEFDGLTFMMDNETPTCRSLDKKLDGADLSTFTFYMIDGFIVSDNVEVAGLETLDMGFTYSDHNPVVLDVTLK